MYLEGLAEQFPALKNGQCKHILSKEMFYDVPRVVVPDYGARDILVSAHSIAARPGQQGAAAWTRASRAGLFCADLSQGQEAQGPGSKPTARGHETR